MKNVIVFLLSICLFNSSYAQQLTIDIAFQKVKDIFGVQDVDYYEAVNKLHNEESTYTFFVDANPLALWEHECYLIEVGMLSGNAKVLSKTELRCPPDDYELIPYLLKKRPQEEVVVPRVANDIKNIRHKRSFLDVSGQNYVVIVSGHKSVEMNYAAFWNDCSFVYQTLTKRYAIPKENIYLLMSDGTDPAVDMIDENRRKFSQPLDLDADGIDDIKYAATKTNLIKTFNDLEKIVGENDHLLVFITNHGGWENPSAGCMDYYVNLYATNTMLGNRVTATELREMLQPLYEKNVRMNVVIGSCYSGGFLEPFIDTKSVVSVSADKTEEAYAAGIGGYNVFLAHWTSAINGADLNNNPVNADYNEDGFISMDEAFNYARLKTEEYHKTSGLNQTPQYQSIPITFGENWSFDKPFVESPTNIIFGDNTDYSDSGTEIFWGNTSLYIKNSFTAIADGEHENPDFVNRKFVRILAKVRNDGRDIYFGGKKIRFYWAQAATAITPEIWLGKKYFMGTEELGGFIGESSIGRLDPNDSVVVNHVWTLPKNVNSLQDRSKDHYFCLYAKIVNDSSDTIPVFNPVENRLEAQLNMSIINKEATTKSASVYFTNPISDNCSYDMELMFRSEKDKAIFNYANIALDLSKTVYYSWERGGRESHLVVPYSRSPYSLQFLESQSKLQNISMVGNGMGLVTMYFDFFDAPVESQTYTIDLIQKDQMGQIVGGETFIIKSPQKVDYIPSSEYNITKYNRNSSELSASSNSTCWFDDENKYLCSESTLTVNQEMNGKEYVKVITTSDGYLYRDIVKLQKNLGIKQVVPSGIVMDHIEVELLTDESYNGMISLSSLLTGLTYYKTEVCNDTQNVRIDTSNLPTGLYVLAFSIDGKVIESYRFSKR